jgi:hypothetical protein
LLSVLACVACAEAEDSALEERVVELSEIAVVADDVGFTGIRDMDAVEDGVWVLDGAPPFIRLLDRNGALRVRFGERGLGPAELSDPRAIQATEGGAEGGVVVWDAARSRAATFDRSGNLVSAEPVANRLVWTGRGDIGSVTYADPYRVRRAGSSFVFGEYARGLMMPSDFRFGRIATAPSPVLAPSALVAALGAATASPDATRELAALPLWDACRDGTVLHWKPESSSIHWLALSGRDLGSVVVPVRAQPLTDEDIESYLRLMLRHELGGTPEEQGMDVRTMVRSRRALFAETAPVGVELRCGEEGAAWLRLFDTRVDGLGRGPTWVQARVDTAPMLWTFPEGFSPVAFEEGRAIGVFEDPAGAQHAAWWEAGDTDS